MVNNTYIHNPSINNQTIKCINLAFLLFNSASSSADLNHNQTNKAINTIGRINIIL